MYEWILPSLREILATSELTINNNSSNNCSSVQAEQQWRVSLAATENLLLQTLGKTAFSSHQGLVLAAPAPLFSQPHLTQTLKTITFTAKPFNPLALMPFAMDAEIAENRENINIQKNCPQESILPLLAADPLGAEQFCLVFTDKFRLVLVLSEHKNGKKEFGFSFDAEIVEQAWRSLGSRVIFTNPELFAELDILVKNYPLVAPNYNTVVQFSQLLLQELTITENNHITYNSPSNAPIPQPENKQITRPDVELLQAFAHEVRTPLTTIRMMTRLLLKKQDLPSNVISRLQIIDHECTEQIERMELLFKAAELETNKDTINTTQSVHSQLTKMSLDQVLQQSIPRWEQAATKRNLKLNVALPKELPMVVSNPNMLDRMLTNLMENFTRSLPPGSCIHVQVIPAGDQLKLQLTPQLDCENQSQSFKLPIKKSLGQLLMFQPETGTISLNISATKNLFQTIGGKLIVRQRPQNAEVLTIFLPLEVSHHEAI
ncbi:HAMP domain-containing histidine kinase [Anabaena sp. FACHB-1237]|uniref:sensor histidine kinase n=1 Tax=Anabaena sp. FACHB-1237 TaxID=2692769 RepID=UPI001680A369|nr:HAMP domain-containing sensor histidine kinase [Anabaena sp. FACHB-1237]MBD2139305.1 HAMP domain-containing histidine kinase [Anabaena sp. FACHB-1237]